ncbi:MAG TPA: serine hydrolase domain-containing protein [Acetobacteraceae bacterium]|jgi:methyl acetate hydrolase|nr:serine hydrolase domain-containing protein [Acetobacteraceae bacterium]
MTLTQTADRVLSQAAASGAVPGVVAMATTADGTIYEGAFGKASLAGDAPIGLNTVFHIASMTKAITGAAAMQLVEQGKIGLDQPAGDIIPQLAEPKVLEGFDAAGQPVLRPARTKVTLRNLLTHTAGFAYDTWNPNLSRFYSVTGLPPARTGKLQALGAPLARDPGTRWEYGINIDWVGRIVDTISGQTLHDYMRQHIFAPLGMTDSGFVLTQEQQARRVPTHTRGDDAVLTAQPLDPMRVPEFFDGGGGLQSTARDYLTFVRAILNGGAGILKPETVAQMGQNHIGALNVQPMPTQNTASSCDVDLFPDQDVKWGLTFLINTKDVPGRRSAGSLAWAGLRNTYYWIDPKKRVGGVFMTQVLPFADPTILGVLADFERAVYAAL